MVDQWVITPEQIEYRTTSGMCAHGDFSHSDMSFRQFPSRV